MANRFFVCSREKPPVEVDIAEDRPVADAEIPYFIRGFRKLEAEYGLDGRIVCFAWGANVSLPFVGPNVIAVLYSDEHCRIPAYVGEVEAVFKASGVFPNFIPRGRPLRLAQIEAAEFLRNLALWVPQGWRWALSPRVRAKCHVLPMGFGFTTQVQPLPFDERPLLVSFLGSVARPARTKWLRNLVGTPKAYCRSTIIEVLRDMQQRYGTDRIRLKLSSGFQESIKDAGRLYFDELAHTQFCLAPRGTTHETWRICDGLRFGCIVVADRLPPHSFYEGSPILQIADWRDLPALMEELLAEPTRMRDLHEQSLRYWRDVMCEDALAARCAKALGLVKQESAKPIETSPRPSACTPAAKSPSYEQERTEL